MHRTGTYCNASNSLHILSSGVIYDSPFGSLISTRSWSDASRAYRYGFNGKEKDFETANDNFPIAIGIGARIYDGRLGRWLSPDPEYKIYINLALYQFTNNNPNYYKEINVEVFDLSNIEDIDAYNAQIELMKSRSPLFRYVYDRLENSETVYTVIFDENNKYPGSFDASINTITLSVLITNVLAQEFFHAFQTEYAYPYDANNPDANPSSNIELEGDYFAELVTSECLSTNPVRSFLENLLSCTDYRNPRYEYLESDEFKEAYKKALDLRLKFYLEDTKEKGYEAPSYTKEPDKSVEPITFKKVIKEIEAEKNLPGPRLQNGDYYSN